MLSYIIYNNGIKGDGQKPPRLMPSVTPFALTANVVANLKVQKAATYKPFML